MNSEIAQQLHDQGRSGDAAAWNRLGELLLREVPPEVSSACVQS